MTILFVRYAVVSDAMAGNYSGVDGVQVAQWGPDSDVDDPKQDWEGELEEMYVDHGNLVLIIEHPDGETVTDVQIPIMARDSWNSFVESLPVWE